MGILFTYIATRSTVDPYIPPQTANIALLARDTSDGFYALSGGHNVLGRLAQFPVQRSVANHLLCDGREVSKESFPELFDYLGNSQGASFDVNYFVLPNYTTAITPATAPAPETATEGTVTTADPTPAPAPAPGAEPAPAEEYPIYGDADSGGRTRHVP